MGISRAASFSPGPDGFPGSHLCLAQLLPVKVGTCGSAHIGLAGLEQPAGAVQGEGVASTSCTSSTTLFIMTSPRQICRLENTERRGQLSSKEASSSGYGGLP